MKITKELYIAAPYAQVAVYAGAQAYTQTTGDELIEAVACEAVADPAHAAIKYHQRHIYRRLSGDNGATWQMIGEDFGQDPFETERIQPFSPSHTLDPNTGRLVSFTVGRQYYRGGRETFSDAGVTNRQQRILCQVSTDRGRSWTPWKPVIAEGAEYDEVHYGPGLYWGRNGSLPNFNAAMLDDRTICQPIVVNLEDGNRYQSGFLHAAWKGDSTDLAFELSDYIRVPLDQSTQGACEPSMIQLRDGRYLVGLRCCGDRDNHTFPCLKYWVFSDDDVRTFSKPEPLCYEDGSYVWSPSSYHQFIRSSADGRVYWIANILDAPTYDSQPRYPLCIAELDEDKLCIVRDSVTVIDDKPEGPDPKRRYTNFGGYEDRRTHEIVLTMPEQPKTTWQDFTADCYRYRIRI